MNTYLNLTALGLAAMLCITSLAACSQKPSSEEIAAQVKIAMEQAEKDKQTAATQAAQTSQSSAMPAPAPAPAPTPAPAPAPVNAPAQKPVKKQVAAKPAAVEPEPVVHEHEHAMPPAESAKPVCANCGVVLAVKVIEEEGKGSGLGVVAGGVAGGLIGNQVGQGTGRDLATIAGAVGGAFAGNKIEKIAKKTKSYDITVKMDDGSEHTYRQATEPDMVKGQKVKIENGVVVKD